MAYLAEVRYGFIRWPAFGEAIDVEPRRVRRQLLEQLLLLSKRLARRAARHRPQPHEVRQAMPRALAQALDDRVRAVIDIAIGVHDGLTQCVALDRRIAAHFSDRHRSDLDEAEPELGQRLVRGPVRIKRAA
ncbi:hypothetical protein [Paenibacillus phytorum]|uniref:hypothetical protein n=1 Tax=Paenibacillus phytorum TaxID=2654977 RepID=UPI001FE70484|nr:hypothetical protein [Paenibacillus phytorum]